MRRINLGEKQKQRIGRVLGCIMVCVLIAASISNWEVIASTNSKYKQVYLDGVLGSDSNAGNTNEAAVKTFSKAKELLDTNGTIIISGKIFVSEEETWSLPASTYGTAVVKIIPAEAANSYSTLPVNTPSVHVSSLGKLTLRNITIIGQSDKLITNKGTVCLDTDSILKNDSNIIDAAGVVTLAGGTTLLGDQIVEHIEAEKHENTLSIGCEDIVYGQLPSPYVIENKSGGDVTFLYKVKGESDSAYMDAAPQEIGSYTVIGISVTTETYESAKVYADFTITKAIPSNVTFPVASTLIKEDTLADSQLSGGLGNGTFTWVDSSQVVKVDNDGYEVLFTPNDTANYDYSGIDGWDSITQTVRRVITVEVLSLDATIDTSSNDNITEAIQDADSKDMNQVETDDQVIKETEQRSDSGHVSDQDSKETSADAKAAGADLNGINTDSKGTDPDDQKSSADLKEKDSNSVEKLKLSAAARKGYDYIQALSTVIDTTEAAAKVLEATRVYNALSADDKVQIPENMAAILKTAQVQAGLFNHISNGITVTGDDLPWYVQLRVSVKAKSEHEDKIDSENSKIIAPYDIKLWNLMEQSKYTLPEGTAVTLSMTAPDMERYGDIVVLHYLSDGTIEYITPLFLGNVMSFKTSSFSLFDVAGSIMLVPGNTTSNNINDPKSTDSTKSTESTSSTKSTESTDSKNNTSGKVVSTKKTIPSTNDNNPILLLIIGAVLAVSLIAILIVTRKKGRKEDKIDENSKDSNLEK